MTKEQLDRVINHIETLLSALEGPLYWVASAGDWVMRAKRWEVMEGMIDNPYVKQSFLGNRDYCLRQMEKSIKEAINAQF